MKFLIRLSIIVLLKLFSAQALLAEETKCPEINSIDSAREVFLKDYQQKKYKKAFNKFSQFVNHYQNATKTWMGLDGRLNASLCFINNNKAKQKLLWAYSDLALAAYKLNDAKLCLSNYIQASNLGYNLFSNKKSKVTKALDYNFLSCISLPNVEKEILSNTCSKKYGDNCFQLKQLVIYKIASKYPKLKSKNPLYPKGLDLNAFGMQGTLFLEEGSQAHIGDESKRHCPKIFWVKNNKIKELKLKTRSKDEYETDLEDMSNCCNITADNLAITKQKNSIKLQISYIGMDCFGGSARWFSEEIYGINFTEYQLKRESRKEIGLNMF